MKKVKFKATPGCRQFFQLRSANRLDDGNFTEMPEADFVKLQASNPGNFFEVKNIPRTAKMVEWKPLPTPKRRRDSDMEAMIKPMVRTLVQTMFEEMTGAAQSKAVKK